ncbi:unnamed protein product [Thelazia callipaeda]|uniref:Folliculin n=1 Tax=Thelazia callipaeda TaxID=103827 RepID=A0A0N5CM44_THECL|nr:unnamed protein product [Thelazia callipaeda]
MLGLVHVLPRISVFINFHILYYSLAISIAMQAVLALCHFCENHGPRVLMTTQSVPENLRDNYCLFRTSKRSTSSLNTGGFFRRGIEESRCAACTSFGQFGLVTNDVESGISYISTQTALNDRVDQLVMHSCLHSLSCEVPATPNDNFMAACSTTKWDNPWEEINREANEGVVLFGDEEHGYTLSFTFRIHDCKARGFLRLFSLVLVSMDKLFITYNYDFFVATMSSIVRRLQIESDVVFNREQEDPSNEVFKQASATRSLLLPAHFLRTQVTKFELDTSRSLAQITNCADIFTQLHMFMVYILRTQTRLCKEYLLEGVPTQDMLVMKERETKTNNDANAVDLNSSRNLESFATLQQIASKLENLRKVDDHSVLEIVLTQLVTGGQIVIKCQDPTIAHCFLLALSNLLPLGCVRLSYAENYQHVFVSNLFGCPIETKLSLDAVDIVVLRMDISLESVCCMRSVSRNQKLPFFSKNYIPPQLRASSKNDNINNCMAQSLVELLTMRKIENFEGYNLSLIACPQYTAPKYRLPTIVIRYKQLLLDNDLTSHVLASVVQNTREEWLSKAKLFYQLGRQKVKIDLKKVLQVLKCSEQN